MDTSSYIDGTSEVDEPEMPSRSFLPALIIIGLIALVSGAAFGYFLGRSRIPAADSAEVGFARDMSIHHEQAVQMAALAYDRTEDNAIRSLAFDILTTQQGQIGIMSGWLDAWDLPWTSAGPRMTWMGMSVDGLMPGMATTEQLNSLRSATGDAADTIFLQLMIPHHRAGVEMAAYAVEHVDREPVRPLAQGMVEAQALEIEYMQELLAAKGQVPVPAAPPAAGEEHDH